jgi:hypothetical protein
MCAGRTQFELECQFSMTYNESGARPHSLKAEKAELVRGCSRPNLVFVKLPIGSLFVRDSTVGSALMPPKSGQSRMLADHAADQLEKIAKSASSSNAPISN